MTVNMLETISVHIDLKCGSIISLFFNNMVIELAEEQIQHILVGAVVPFQPLVNEAGLHLIVLVAHYSCHASC